MKELTAEAERSHLWQGLIYVDVSFAFDSVYASNKIHANEYYAVGKNPFGAYRFVPIVQLKLTSQYVVHCSHAYLYFLQISNAQLNIQIAGSSVTYFAGGHEAVHDGCKLPTTV